MFPKVATDMDYETPKGAIRRTGPMTSLKSQSDSFYKELLLRTYQGAARSTYLRPKTIQRDLSTLASRFDAQGMTFVTKVLPSLGKCLDKALSSGAPFAVNDGFTLSSKAPFAPVLFSEWWKMVFDAQGEVRVNKDGTAPKSEAIHAVRAVRQVCYLLYKLEGAHSHQSEVETVRDFVAVDRSLPDPDSMVELSGKTRRVLQSARILLSYVLKDVNLEDITPGHGPGAVATGEKPHEKMNFRRIHAGLEVHYPFVDWNFLNYSHLAETLEKLEECEELPHATAKVVLVPKDSRGPRLISMEPLEIQWIQQGQMRELVRVIEREGNITCGKVNFTNQEVNRELALLSSVQGDLVTLDMKEASDRVSLWLVRQLLPGNILQYVEASRSSQTLLPDGTLLALRKFAPMGSAICFPIEALIFWALGVCSLVDVRLWKDLHDLPLVYVFGDDIITSNEAYGKMRPIFDELHLRFNEDKCCTARFFRESCGMDAFFGHSVTPIRVKAPWAPRLSPAALASYVSYYNSFRKGGYDEAADWVAQSYHNEFRKLPVVRVSGKLMLALVHPGLSVRDTLDGLRQRFKMRFNAHLCQDEVRVPVVSCPTITVGTPEWGELFLALVRMGPPDPFGFRGEVSPACSYPVPHRQKVRWAWVAVEPLLSY